MLNSSITHDNSDLFLNDLENNTEEAGESGLIDLFNTYDIDGEEFISLANMQIQYLENILTTYPEFKTNETLFRESLNHGYLNIQSNSHVSADLCLKIFNMTVQGCKLELQKASIWAVGEGLIISGISGIGGILYTTAAMTSALMTYQNCMGSAELNYANCQ